MNKSEADYIRNQRNMLMARVRISKRDGVCVICGKPVAVWIDTGEARMVCASQVCYHQWLLPGSKYEDGTEDALSEHEDG